jgi:para-nitrobenzyl esterase
MASVLLFSAFLACGGGGGSTDPGPSQGTAPVFTLQPQNASASVGAAASFTVAASGSPSPTFQWESSSDGQTWTAISGATAATYSFTVQLTNDGLQLRAKASNSAGTATSSAATLTVLSAPAITLDPVDQTVTLGRQASFEVAASGHPSPALQWQSSPDGSAWTDVAGAGTSTYQTPATTSQDDGTRFRLKAMNTAGTAYSQAAILTVLSATGVNTQYGQIQGNTFSGGLEFLGIPYAKPPVGGLRWKAPQAPDAWSGVLATQAFKPACPQMRFQPGQTVGEAVGDEDCLYLNVWTPSMASPSLPVLVFLHGGAHQQGSTNEVSQGAEIYNGQYMASLGQAVIVTPEFRVGPLGYLVHPGLDAESASGTSGNFGVLDQLMALRWVQNNIAKFGGDPTRVMVFGESAGGVDVGNLLVVPQAAGLFQRAAIESAFPLLGTYADATTKGVAWANTFSSAATDAAKIAELRGLDWQTIVSTEQNTLAGGVVSQDWQPVLDHQLFPQMPGDAIAAGAFHQVPLLIGSNADEMNRTAPAVVTPAQVTAALNAMVPIAYQAQAHALYPSGSTNDEARASYVQILTDSQFTSGVRRAARAVSAPASPVWRYFFTHTESGAFASTGSFHGLELPYVFNTLGDTTYATLGLLTSGDQAVENAMLKYWVAFARNGDPNGSGLENWPSLNGTQDRYMQIAPVLNGTQSGVRTDKCDFWDTLKSVSGATAPQP